MAIIKKYSANKNLQKYATFVTDTEPDSLYFKITELEPVFTGGKNAFLIEGTDYLKQSTEIQIEIKDVEGNPIYFEPGDGIPEYYEGISKVVAVYVYDDTPIGEATITILGELKEYDDDGIRRTIPDEWKGSYNVKWQRRIKINKNLPNVTKVRFYKKPIVTVTENTGSFFENTIETLYDSGSVIGSAISPAVGTDITGYSGPIFYKLTKTSGTFPDDIEDNGIITVDGLLSNIEIYEQLSETEITISTPYTSGSVIQSFASTPYTASYNSTTSTTESPILGSFARFNFSRLATFAGDVARVKVYSKSATQNTDYVLIQDIRIESTELLTQTISGSAVPYGNFDASYTDYWDVAPLTHTVTQDNTKVFAGLKIDYDTGNSTAQTISSSLDLILDAGTEYTLKYNLLFSGSVSTNKTFKSYLTYTYSGSYIEDEVTNITSDDLYKQVQSISNNYIAPYDTNYKLKFVAAGDDWYFGKVSLRASQETSFSPDSLTFNIPVTRNLERETLDFKFEFYDINNNYIPVNVTAREEFIGGNLSAIDKFIEVDATPGFVFTFDSDAIAAPENQTINLTFTKNRVLNDLLITSQSYDTGGIAIPSSTYSGYNYPGTLTVVSQSISEEQYTLSIDDFTGSLHGNPPSPSDVIVSSIRYTLTESGSISPATKSFTIYKQTDGARTKEVRLVASPIPMFFKRTDLSPKKPQTTTITATKGNLPESNIFTITSGSYGYLLQTSGTGEVETYTIDAGTSGGSNTNTLDYNDGPATYTFQILDNRGVIYSSSIAIDTVVVNDSFNVSSTQDTHTFTAESTGEVLDPFTDGDVVLTAFVGGEQICYDAGFGNNTWCVGSYTATGSTAKALSVGTDSATVGITAFPESNNSASISLTIDYKDGLGVTETVNKTINYTKSKKAAPVLTLVLDPNNQTVPALSTGVQNGTFTDISASVNQQYDGVNTSLSFDTLTAVGPTIGSLITSTSTGVISLSSETLSGINSDTITVSATVTDSEGTSRSISGSASISKTLVAAPTVIATLSSDSQTVFSGSFGTCTPQSASIFVSEGSSTYSYDASLATNSTYHLCLANSTNIASQTQCQFLPNTPTNVSGSQTVACVYYKNSEGTVGNLSKTHFVGVALQGTNGDSGSRGPGLLYIGDYSTKCTEDPSFPLKNNDSARDAVSNAGCYYVWQGVDGTAISSTTTPPIGGDVDWEEFTSFSAVATGLLIAENSYVQCTLNIGTNASGSAANIALVGGTTSPYISLGQTTQGFNQNGAYLGITSTCAVFSVKGGSNCLSWDGTTGTLSIAGSITVTGGNAATQDFAYACASDACATAIAFAAFSASLAEANACAYASAQDLIVSSSAVQQANDFVSCLADGNWAFGNTFINGTTVAAPIIAGNAGYIAGIFKVGGTGAITLDGTTCGMYIGAGNYNNSDTAFLVSGSGDFSLKDQLTWCSSTNTLTINGAINVTGGNAATVDFACGAADTCASAYASCLANGTYAGGTFIDGTIVYAPTLAGNTGYISDRLLIGNNGISLCGSGCCIFVGAGNFNNSDTAFFVNNDSCFSLGQGVTWNGSELSVCGIINTASGSIAGWCTTPSFICSPTVALRSSGSAQVSKIDLCSNQYYACSRSQCTYTCVTETCVVDSGYVLGTFKCIDIPTSNIADTGNIKLTVGVPAKTTFVCFISEPVPVNFNHSATHQLGICIVGHTAASGGGSSTVVCCTLRTVGTHSGTVTGATNTSGGYTATTLTLFAPIDHCTYPYIRMWYWWRTRGCMSGVTGGDGSNINCVILTNITSGEGTGDILSERAACSRTEIASNGIATAESTITCVRIVELGEATSLTCDQCASAYFSCNVYVNGSIICSLVDASDSRIKDNIRDIHNPLGVVKSLCGREWDWKSIQNVPISKHSRYGVGVIADEASLSAPHLVQIQDNYAGLEQFKRFDYNALDGYFIESIKTLANSVEELQATVGQLNDCITYLKSQISGSI